MNIVYTPGKVHQNITTQGNSMREINRLPVKMKLLTSTYILQSTRAAFNQNEVNPTCQLCQETSEDMEHFLLNCKLLETSRNVIMTEISEKYRTLTNKTFHRLNTEQKIKVILDCTNIENILQSKLHTIEYHCRRLVYALHTERYRALSFIKPQKQKRCDRFINTLVY